MSNKTRNASIVIGTALLAGMAAAGASVNTSTSSNGLFGLTDLGHGYMVSDATESKCGSNKTPTEAKCGANKAQQAAEKAAQMKEIREAKCGEAKCGANKGK